MKDIITYINESKSNLQKFKISDLRQELQSNHVTASRIQSVIKFFESGLGEAPYYCISENNDSAYELNILHKKLFLSDSSSLTGDYSKDVCSYEIFKWSCGNDADEETVKNEYDRLSKNWKKHVNILNAKVDDDADSAPAKLKEKFNKLKSEVIPLKLKNTGFGKYHPDQYLSFKYMIAYYNDTYIPVIVQIRDYKNNKNSFYKGGGHTYYVACKDID